MKAQAALVAAALLAALPAAALPPQRVELGFSVSTGGFTIGETRERLEHGAGRYRVTSTTEPRGIAALFIGEIRRESRGAVTATGQLRPERFEEAGRRGGTRIAEFDWSAGSLTLVHGDSARTVALPAGTLDQASLAYAFAFRGEAPPAFTVHLTDGRGLKEYRYRLVGEETLRTPLGEMRARRYEKVRDANDRRAFEFWLATDHHLLPVKLRYVERNGDVFDSVVTRIELP